MSPELERLASWPRSAAINITIIGAGNLGHVMAGQLAARENTKVFFLTRKASQIAAPMMNEGIRVTIKGPTKDTPDTFVTGRVTLVSDKPADVIPQADVVLVTVPSHARPTVLSLIAPHIAKDRPVFIGAFPGIGGFDWIARAVFKQHGLSNAIVFSIKDIPFMSSNTTFGKSATNLGRKKLLFLATNRFKESDETKLCAYLMTEMAEGIPCVVMDSFMTITLTPANPIMHPAIMYGMFGPFSQWDGRPLKEKPLFYEDVSELSSYFTERADADIQAIKRGVVKATRADLTAVWPLRVNMKNVYGDVVGDNRTLMLAMRTNRAYASIRTPLAPHPEGGFVPDIGHRFFHEDVPYGLVILRDIADMVNVKVPMIDELLMWAQGLMGKQYLVNGELVGRDMYLSGAPSEFGFTDINDLVWGHLPHPPTSGNNHNHSKL
eukprot:c19580_g1_i1.p1 GENE.c19580_g1_i1~~c19580_g1_i1.p1  ORF type:complete len:445 (+),score=86.08 c19580_g1_i1:29-1336(+)